MARVIMKKQEVASTILETKSVQDSLVPLINKSNTVTLDIKKREKQIELDDDFEDVMESYFG